MAEKTINLEDSEVVSATAPMPDVGLLAIDSGGFKKIPKKMSLPIYKPSFSSLADLDNTAAYGDCILRPNWGRDALGPSGTTAGACTVIQFIHFGEIRQQIFIDGFNNAVYVKVLDKGWARVNLTPVSGGVISCTSVRKGGGLRDGGDDFFGRGAEIGFPGGCERGDEPALLGFGRNVEADQRKFVPFDSEGYNGPEHAGDNMLGEMFLRNPEFAVLGCERNVLSVDGTRHRMGLSDGVPNLDEQCNPSEDAGKRHVVRMEAGGVHLVAIRRKEVSHV